MTKGSLLSEFKEKARKTTGGPPSFLTTNGWKLGLSYGPVPMPTKEAYDLYAPSTFKKLGMPIEPPSHEAVEKLSDASPLREQWILSASLFPAGRSSTEADWVQLGRFVAALGARPEHLCTPFETTHPNDVHYWIWNESDAQK